MKDAAWFIVAMIVLAIISGTAAFMAPCGCYAGTPVKDVPARCIDVGGQTR